MHLINFNVLMSYNFKPQYQGIYPDARGVKFNAMNAHICTWVPVTIFMASSIEFMVWGKFKQTFGTTHTTLVFTHGLLSILCSILHVHVHVCVSSQFSSSTVPVHVLGSPGHIYPVLIRTCKCTLASTDEKNWACVFCCVFRGAELGLALGRHFDSRISLQRKAGVCPPPPPPNIIFVVVMSSMEMGRGL